MPYKVTSPSLVYVTHQVLLADGNTMPFGVATRLLAFLIESGALLHRYASHTVPSPNTLGTGCPVYPMVDFPEWIKRIHKEDRILRKTELEYRMLKTKNERYHDE